MRLFECTHSNPVPITPHSHRFDFTCVVLEGTVHNLVWQESDRGSLYELAEQIGKLGNYELLPMKQANYACVEHIYHKGDVYSMRSEEIHSIFFSKGAKVLFIEGPERSEKSLVLQPVVNGRVIPTLKTEDWMFIKE